jgi:hypothetical protein
VRRPSLLRGPTEAEGPVSPAPPARLEAPRELFVRHARKDGRPVALVRAVDHGDSCVVEAEVHPTGRPQAAPVRPGPYTFANAHEATAFVTEAVEALMYLGCDVTAE